jgi:hypothetical protein
MSDGGGSRDGPRAGQPHHLPARQPHPRLAYDAPTVVPLSESGRPPFTVEPHSRSTGVRPRRARLPGGIRASFPATPGHHLLVTPTRCARWTSRSPAIRWVSAQFACDPHPGHPVRRPPLAGVIVVLAGGLTACSPTTYDPLGATPAPPSTTTTLPTGSPRRAAASCCHGRGAGSGGGDPAPRATPPAAIAIDQLWAAVSAHVGAADPAWPPGSTFVIRLAQRAAAAAATPAPARADRAVTAFLTTRRRDAVATSAEPPAEHGGWCYHGWRAAGGCAPP